MSKVLVKHCDYRVSPTCLNVIPKSKGTRHKVFISDDNGWPTEVEVIKYACNNCEMEFDND